MRFIIKEKGLQDKYWLCCAEEVSLSFQMPLEFCFLTFFKCTEACFHSTVSSNTGWDCVIERLQSFAHPVRFEMLCWGKLNSKASYGDINGFHQMFRRAKITDVSTKDGLTSFLRDADRRVTVVTSHKRKRKQTYKREFLFTLLILFISTSIELGLGLAHTKKNMPMIF